MRYYPYSDSGSLKNLVYYLEPEDVTKFGGYEAEIKRIISVISKRQYNRNVLIYGDSGVGKSSLIDKLVSILSTDDYSDKYGSFNFFYLDVNALISKCTQDLHPIFMKITKLLTKKMENVLIIDDMHLLLQNDLIKNELFHLLKTDNICVISTIDTQSYMSQEYEMYDLFEKIHLEEPFVYEIYDMIKYQIHELEVFHGVKISKKMANWIMQASVCFNLESNFRLSLSTLDGIMTCAKFNHHAYVRKSDFFDFFSLETKDFRKMSYEQKWYTSIHEIGHLILYVRSEELSDYIPIAITCIPFSAYRGRTYFEASPELRLRDDETFYIKLIAALLAGKIAEEIFGFPPNSGVTEDLRKANKLAIDMATSYGLNPDAGDRVLITDENDESVTDEDLLQEDLYNSQFDEITSGYVESILQKARKHAEEVIKKNKDIISTLATELANEGILTKADIDKLI